MFIQKVAKTDIKKSIVPKVKDIITAKKKKIYDNLTNILNDEIEGNYRDWAKSLMEENEPEDILAAILNYCFEEELNPAAYGEIREFGEKGKQLDKQGKTRLFVALGRKDEMSPKKLVDFIVDKAPVKFKDIRDVQIMDNFSFITVPFNKADVIISCFQERGQRPLISLAKKVKSR